MSPVQIILAPLLVLLPSVVPLDPIGEPTGAATDISQGFRIEPGEQVRIEQRLTIRISPRGPIMREPEPFFDEQDSFPHLEERHMGKCLPISEIAGVQVGEENRLLLFMRDHKIVSLSLERACLARDFYSGFYVERNGDGMICVDRDQLHARSGANCTISKMRRLVEVRE